MKTDANNAVLRRRILSERNLLIAAFVLAISFSFTFIATAEIVLVPLASFVLGAYLSKRSRSHYITFVLWLFFLSPMLRRMVDFHLGSARASAIIASPILACVGSLPAPRRIWSIVASFRLRWIVLIVASFVYAAFVGFMLHSPVALAEETVTWVGPLIFALYLFDQRAYMPEMFRVFREQFLLGTLLMGLYGIYQYAVLAPWDATWMEQSNLTTIGSPEPFAVRIFSTMNAPQTFADFIVCGILLSSASTRRLRFLAIPIGLMALGLTNSRSAWIGGAAGLIFTILFFPPKRRLQILFALSGFAVALAVVIQIPQVNEQLSRRFSTFTDLKSDSSVNERLASQQQAVTLFLDRPFGNGFGGASNAPDSGPTHGVATVQGIYMNDNGLQQVMLTFGWFGSLVFFIGFSGAVLSCFRTSALPELISINAGLLSLIVQIPTMGLFASAPAFLLWSVMMLSIAYQENQSFHRAMAKTFPVTSAKVQQA